MEMCYFNLTVHFTSTLAFSCFLIVAPKDGFQIKILIDMYDVYVENMTDFLFRSQGLFKPDETHVVGTLPSSTYPRCQGRTLAIC